jgi:hypothetical protein
MASYLWIGGEDLDFPNGVPPSIVQSGSSQYRTSYARCALYNVGANTTSCRSNSFPGGAVTSLWLHWTQVSSALFNNMVYLGVGLNSAAQCALAVGGNTTHCTLWKFSGGTWTQLAVEAGASIPSSGTFQIDMNIQSFGASATVNVYINGNLVINYVGSTTVTGVTNLDCVAIPGQTTSGMYVSEIIVTDTIDTRGLSLATLTPASAGTTDTWTGNYSNVNPITINDASVAYTNATAQDFEWTTSALLSGSFSIPMVKVASRASLPAGSTPTLLKQGFKTSGGTAVDAGQSVSIPWKEYESYFATNPVSGVGWVQGDITTGPIQADLRSG